MRAAGSDGSGATGGNSLNDSRQVELMLHYELVKLVRMSLNEFNHPSFRVAETSPPRLRRGVVVLHLPGGVNDIHAIKPRRG